ncbi:hypothetical protein ACFQ1I_09780 [Kitasatospora arboriphila]
MSGLSGALAVAGPAAAALALAAALTGPVRAFALRRGITDRPGPRKAHTRPTPTSAASPSPVPPWPRPAAS